jgi:hypothetical protein
VDGAEIPFAFVAFTVNVYAVSLERPVIVSGEEEPEIVAPLLAVTV